MHPIRFNRYVENSDYNDEDDDDDDDDDDDEEEEEEEEEADHRDTADHGPSCTVRNYDPPWMRKCAYSKTKSSHNLARITSLHLDDTCARHFEWLLCSVTG
ncbi:unnamed protein product [Echinostoma caproni]|uniref:Uncharacterized protein n=1 Tax=Echinostoma caproni TaxID=27848 RepID=A0A183BE98_9TREM|nr:unnamed protein product [Echinostoma caproni]